MPVRDVASYIPYDIREEVPFLDDDASFIKCDWLPLMDTSNVSYIMARTICLIS